MRDAAPEADQGREGVAGHDRRLDADGLYSDYTDCAG